MPTCSIPGLTARIRIGGIVLIEDCSNEPLTISELLLNRAQLSQDHGIEVRVEVADAPVVDRGQLERGRQAGQELPRLVLRNDRCALVPQEPGHGFLPEPGLLPGHPETVLLVRRFRHAIYFQDRKLKTENIEPIISLQAETPRLLRRS